MQRLMNAKVEDTKLNAQIVMKLMVPLRPALSSYITGALGLVLQLTKGVSVCVCVCVCVCVSPPVVLELKNQSIPP